MRTITFPDSWFGQFRAKLHELPYGANNALIRALQIPTSPTVANKSIEVTKELNIRSSRSLGTIVDTTKLKVGDIVSMTIKKNGMPHVLDMAPVVISVTQRTRTGLGITSAKVFGYDTDNQLKSHSSGRLPPVIWARQAPNWIRGKPAPANPPIKIGTLQIRTDDIEEIILHRASLLTKGANSVKRWYNGFLDMFKAEAKILKNKSN